MTILRLGLLLVVFLAAAGPAVGQTIPYGGSEVFRFALHQKNITPETDVRTALRNPAQTIIIAIGDTDGLNQKIPAQQLRSFLISGGAILIASNRSNRHDGFPAATWRTEFRIGLTGQPLETAPENAYQQVASQPNVVPVPQFDADTMLRGLFLGLRKPVATNRPSEMELQTGPNVWDRAPGAGLELIKLAGYPARTRRALDRRPVVFETNQLAVAIRPLMRAPGRPPAGRMLVLADHNVFVNGMLGFKADPAADEGYTFDNGNWEFLNRTIAWLQAGLPQPRTKCLFIENGRIVEQFAVELPPGDNRPNGMPNLPPEVLANLVLNLADPWLNEQQEKDTVGKILERNPEWVRRIIRNGLFALTILFAWMALRRLLRGYRKPEAAPLPLAVAEGMLPRGGIVRQRTDAQLEVGNLYEAARRRVRDRFDRLGGAPGRDGQMPPVLVANDVRDAELLRSAVGWLWPIGYGDAPVPVPPAEWDRVNALLERLVRRAAVGDWSFGVEV